MRGLLVTFVGFVLFSALSTGVACAATSPKSASPKTLYPEVANLTPFSPPANYMSLPGYLRYLSHGRLRHWLSYTQAVRVVQSEERGL